MGFKALVFRVLEMKGVMSRCDQQMVEMICKPLTAEKIVDYWVGSTVGVNKPV